MLRRSKHSKIEGVAPKEEDTHLIIFGTLACCRCFESAQNAVCAVYSAHHSLPLRYSTAAANVVLSAVPDVLKDHTGFILRVKQSLLDCCYYHWPNDTASQDLILEQHLMAFLHACNV